MKNSINAVIIASLFFFVSTNTATADMPNQEIGSNFITRPMFGFPSLWLRDSSVKPRIEINSLINTPDLNSVNSEDYLVLLKKSNGPVSFEVELQVEKTEKKASSHVLHFSVPGDIPVDLFDLEIFINTNGKIYSDYQPNAVKIIDKVKQHYFIVHITDIHVDDPRGYTVNFFESAQYRVIKKMTHMINLLDPEFVVITGDHVFGASYCREYPRLYELLQDFDVPIFMSPGNHDVINHDIYAGNTGIDGIKIFEDFFAPLNFTFSYGNLKYVSLNSMDWDNKARQGINIITLTPGGTMSETQLDWFEQELASSDAEITLVGYHHPPHNSFQGTGAERVIALARNYSVSAVLTGHTHFDENKLDDPVLYLTTSSVMFSGFQGSYPAIRILEIQENNLVSWNYEEPHWSVPIYRDNPPYSNLRNLNTPAFYCEFSPANNGNNQTVTATLTNHLHTGFQDISLEFIMPSSAKETEYETTGGDIVDILYTGTHKILYIRTNIDPASSIEIEVSPVISTRE